jgi:hypothetical protein
MNNNLKELELKFINEYKKLRTLFYGKNEAIEIMIEQLIEDINYLNIIPPGEDYPLSSKALIKKLKDSLTL